MFTAKIASVALNDVSTIISVSFSNGVLEYVKNFHFKTVNWDKPIFKAKVAADLAEFNSNEALFTLLNSKVGTDVKDL